MSATLDGSKGLTIANPLVGATPTYPIFMFCAVKATDAGAAHIGLSINDGNTSGFDILEMQYRWDIASNPVYYLAIENGGSAPTSPKTGMVSGAWNYCAGLSIVANNRFSFLNGVAGTQETTLAAPTGLAYTTIGARYWGGALVTGTVGKIAEGGVAYNFGDGLSQAEILARATAWAVKLAAGWKATDIEDMLPFLVAYEPMLNGINEGGITLAWTYTGVTFDNGADHARRLSNPWLMLDMPMQDDAPSATVVDESEYGNDGATSLDDTENYSVEGPGGELPKALEVDHPDNIYIAYPIDISETGTATIGFFTKQNVPIDDHGIILDNSNEQSLWLHSPDTLSIIAGTTRNITCGVDTTEWHHYAIVFAADGSMTLYIDGILIGTFSGARTGLFSITHICNGFEIAGDGPICGFRVYSRVLSLAEIQAEAARGGLWSESVDSVDPITRSLYLRNRMPHKPRYYIGEARPWHGKEEL